jgi:hypothetical protein
VQLNRWLGEGRFRAGPGGQNEHECHVTLSPMRWPRTTSFNFVISPTEPVHVTVVDRGHGLTSVVSGARALPSALHRVSKLVKTNRNSFG